MRLDELVRGLEMVEITGDPGTDITGLAVDSRKVRPGGLFIAIRGHEADGHDYIDAALSAGAAAVMAETKAGIPVPTVVVGDSRKACAPVARRFFGEPDLRLAMAGITGTNGKTSTAFMLRSIMRSQDGKAGLIGTVGTGIGDTLEPAGQTTPGPVELFGLLSHFADSGCRSAVMEVSSHAAVQGRTSGIEFDVGVFTNITRDHLDYHGSFEEYLEAKESFVRSLRSDGRKKADGALVYNIDDSRLGPVADRFKGRTVSFGLGGKADLRAVDVRADLSGTSFTISSDEGRLPVSMALLGGFTVYNALAAAAAAGVMGASLRAVKEGLENVGPVPGRFQVIRGGAGQVVIVDYAHTPDALESLLKFCRELGPERLITVFGCGGDRDRGKRPEMGGIAARLSDMTIVTSDNPRTEDPGSIIDEIMAGVEGGGARRIEDRAEAIRAAITDARPGDLVVIAGKGHEDYQVLGREKIHFSDTEQAADVLRGLEV